MCVNRLRAAVPRPNRPRPIPPAPDIVTRFIVMIVIIVISLLRCTYGAAWRGARAGISPSPTAPTVSGCSASRSSTARLFEGLTTMVAGKQSPNEAAACG